MPTPVKTRAVAVVGLLLLIPIGLGLVRDSLTLETAGLRAGVLLVILTVVDRVGVPIVRMMVGDPTPDRRTGAPVERPPAG
jgi:hypothetical protein